MFVLAWVLWKERNQLIFQDKDRAETEIWGSRRFSAYLCASSSEHFGRMYSM